MDSTKNKSKLIQAKLIQAKLIQSSWLVCLSAILYGSLGYLGTHVLGEHFSISTMSFWRFLVATLWMLPFVIKKQREKRVLRTLDARSFWLLFFLGSLSYIGTSTLYFVASRFTGTGLAMVIFFAYPLGVALLDWIISKKRLSVLTSVSLAGMVIGLMLLKNPASEPSNLWGILFALLDAACYAVYLVLSKSLSKQVDYTVSTLIICAGSTLFFIPSMLYSHSFIVPNSLQLWVYLLALGVLATGLPIQLMLAGLAYISSMRASILSVLEPLVTVLLGMVLLRERIDSVQLLGAFFLMGCALLVQFQKEL